MQKRYGVLRFISGFYKVIGIIVGVITIISALGICATSVLGTSLLGGITQNFNQSGIPFALGASSVVAGIISALFTIIGGALGALAFYAFGELISLFISLEENTRNTASLLVNKS